VKSFARFAPNDALARIGFLNAKTNYKDYLFLRGAFTPSTVAGLTGQSEKDVFESLANLNLSDYPRERNLNLAAYLESNIYMENQLLKDTDCMSMWHSLEVRVPFLDRELMELMHRIKPATKFNFSQPKYLLTKAFSDLLPDEIVFRKKQGFTFPFSIWLKNNMDHFKSLLPDTPETKKLVTGFLEGKVHWSRLWALMVWEKFKN
jgi:asparagine synthase (glutamine-hydrolysing)